MCVGSFAKCLGITLIVLSLVCVICNILLFFPGGTNVAIEHITDEVWYFGGILGSGVLIIFPALVFLGLKNNNCCGCCGNESCGRRFAMLSSLLFAAVGVLGGSYSVIVSALGINNGPKCVTFFNKTSGEKNWTTPFANEQGDYLFNTSLWSLCEEPHDVVPWHLSLFSMLLAIGTLQVVLCAAQVLNGLLGVLCGDCCRCNEQVSVMSRNSSSLPLFSYLPPSKEFLFDSSCLALLSECLDTEAEFAEYSDRTLDLREYSESADEQDTLRLLFSKVAEVLGGAGYHSTSSSSSFSFLSLSLLPSSLLLLSLEEILRWRLLPRSDFRRFFFFFLDLLREEDDDDEVEELLVEAEDEDADDADLFRFFFILRRGEIH
ncbi:hypothetical protein INR49_023966 [Caranx melampygus]|nr:hypothetical protein INR49_023966 [Caranx melampygus]